MFNMFCILIHLSISYHENSSIKKGISNDKLTIERLSELRSTEFF